MRRNRLAGYLVLVVGSLVIGGGLVGFFLKKHQVDSRDRAVEEVRDLGGSVMYGYEFQGPLLPGPEWGRALLGDNAFAKVEFISFDKHSQVRDHQLIVLDSFDHLKEVNLDAPNLTDRALEYVKSPCSIEFLSIARIELTDITLERLKAFRNLRRLTIDDATPGELELRVLSVLPPNCSIGRALVGWTGY